MKILDRFFIECDNLEHTYCVCVTATILSMGTKFLNKEEIVSSTRGEESVTLRLSLLRVFTGKMYIFFCLGYLLFSFVEKKISDAR